ncbi:Sporulation-specific protein 5 [Exophiala dermatitidis]
MSDKPATQTASSTTYTGYPQTRMPYSGTAYPQFNGGMNLSNANPLANMQNLKATLPASGHVDSELGTVNRSGYSSPLMVLPSGQTVPLANFYGQTQNATAEAGPQLPYIPTGMFPNFLGNTTMGSAGLPAYGWPYAMSSNVTGFDAVRRGSWSSNEENAPTGQGVALQGQSDYYTGFPYMPAAAASQHYIPGPIQPMKCQDNKSYEMVNLDELVSRDPPIPRAVPALWTNQEDLSLAKCLQNPEGITNVYIRGFMPDTSDEDLERWASRFGEIESCKAIIEQDTGKCKGFGFVMYYSPAAAENCIRGFFHLGFQASYAQKSRNSRLKDLEDKNSTNIYCTGVPIDWNESGLAKHFLPYQAVSTKICRDVPSGVSKEVGFARFETRDIAERVIREFHSVMTEHDGVKLFLRFADTKAQKQLKQQSQERRNWRSREYSYSVEHTPSPTLTRLQGMNNHISPGGSYQSPAGTSNAFTPATSVSPAEMPAVNKSATAVRSSAWPMQGGLQSITNTTTIRNTIPATPSTHPYIEVPPKAAAIVPIVPDMRDAANKTKAMSPKKVTIQVEPASGKENLTSTSQSSK